MREQRGADDDGGEGTDAGDAGGAARNALAEQQRPATIGSALVSTVATPAVASAPPRWKPNWSATKPVP